LPMDGEPIIRQPYFSDAGPHLLREVDDFREISENGKRLSEEIHACFKALKQFIESNPSMDERWHQKVIFDKN